MVSRRNFFTIMTVLTIMIFMFLFVSVIKQYFTKFDENKNGVSVEDVQQLSDDYALLQKKLLSGAGLGGEVIYLTGYAKSPVDQVVEGWGLYAKQTVRQKTSLAGVSQDAGELPRAVIVNGEGLTLKEDGEILLELAKKGVTVIFATMPEPKVLDGNKTLCTLMGIDTVYAEKVRLDGMHLLPGLLIGGETIYEEETDHQDPFFQVPWYMVGTGTKTYMMGMVEDTLFTNPFLPAILWRNTVGEGSVFCVNGEFMDHSFGIGLLTAFLAEADSYYIYPVVNAQNLVLAGYGGFADENGEILDEFYNQNQCNFFRDTVWPTIIALNEKTAAKISLMAAPQMEYESGVKPLSGKLEYYLRLLNEVGGEAGLSTKKYSDITLEEKLGRDEQYWRSETGDYELRSVFLDRLEENKVVTSRFPDVRTVVCIREECMPVEYLDERITVQTATSQGVQYEYLDDLLNKGYETALGYNCIVLDMSQAAYPTPAFAWEDYSRKFTSNLSTYWMDYRGFEQTTISESDSRIRRFLALDYSVVRRENQILLHVDNLQDKVYFVLKLNGEILDETMTIPYQDLKNGFYLLEIEQPDTEISVTRKKSFIY